MNGCKVQKYSYSGSVNVDVSKTYFWLYSIIDESKDSPSSLELVTVWGALSRFVHSIASPFFTVIGTGSYGGFPGADAPAGIEAGKTVALTTFGMELSVGSSASCSGPAIALLQIG